MDKKLRNTLLSLGITPNLKGFDYIVEMIKVIREEKEKTKITVLYEVVGRKSGASGTRVERAIRHAISKVDIEKWINMGGSYKFKNSGFLYTLELLTREE